MPRPPEEEQEVSAEEENDDEVEGIIILDFTNCLSVFELIIKRCQFSSK